VGYGSFTRQEASKAIERRRVTASVMFSILPVLAGSSSSPRRSLSSIHAHSFSAELNL